MANNIKMLFQFDDKFTRNATKRFRLYLIFENHCRLVAATIKPVIN